MVRRLVVARLVVRRLVVARLVVRRLVVELLVDVPDPELTRIVRVNTAEGPDSAFTDPCSIVYSPAMSPATMRELRSGPPSSSRSNRMPDVLRPSRNVRIVSNSDEAMSIVTSLA